MTHTRRTCFNHCCISLNLDRFRNLTDLERRIYNNRAIDLQHDPRLRERAKSRQRHLQPVRPQREIWQDIRAGLVTDTGSHAARLRLRGGNFGAGQYGPTLILHGAADLCSVLRAELAAVQNRHEKCEEQKSENAFHRPSTQTVARV